MGQRQYGRQLDQQVYMVFTPGQIRVVEEIGSRERTYDTTGMTVEKHRDDNVLVIGQYLEQLEEITRRFEAPVITGKTPQREREKIYGAFKRGEIKLPPPTLWHLGDLARHATVEDALAWARTRVVVAVRPKLWSLDGVITIVLPWDPE